MVCVWTLAWSSEEARAYYCKEVLYWMYISVQSTCVYCIVGYPLQGAVAAKKGSGKIKRISRQVSIPSVSAHPPNLHLETHLGASANDSALAHCSRACRAHP